MNLSWTLIEKAATDSGFDCTPQVVSPTTWIFHSSQFAVQVWLEATAAGCQLGLNEATLTQALADFMQQVPKPAPAPWQGWLFLPAQTNLYENLHAVFRQLYSLIQETGTKTAQKGETQALGLVFQRRKQALFRARLIAYWEGRCAITGLDYLELLRASHLKPWADCLTDAERLDPFNGLLLSPTWDALIDQGLVSFTATGGLLIAKALLPAQQKHLGITGTETLSLAPAHQPYFSYHRTKIFKGE